MTAVELRDIHAADDPIARLRDAVRASVRDGGSALLRLEQTLAPDARAERSLLEAVLRLTRAGERPPPARGELMAWVLGAGLRVVEERSVSVTTDLVRPADARPAVQEFLDGLDDAPPSWWVEGRIALVRVTLTLVAPSN